MRYCLDYGATNEVMLCLAFQWQFWHSVLIAASSGAEAAKKPGVKCTSQQLNTNASLTCTAKGGGHTVICLEGGMMMCCVPSKVDIGSYTCSSTTWSLIVPGGGLPQLQPVTPSGGPPQLTW